MSAVAAGLLTGWRLPAGVVVTLGLAFAAAPALLDQGQLRFLLEVFVILAMAQMWNLVAGYAGLLSMGHQVFVGLGAYALFGLSNLAAIPPWPALPFAMAVAALFAVMVGPLLFRLRDAYFAVGTWVAAEIVRILIGKTALVGGVMGMPLRAGRTIDRTDFTHICYWLALALVVASLLGMFFLLRSRFGLALMAMRDNDAAAANAGIDVRRVRLAVFVVSAMGCAAAGAIFYMANYFVSATAAFDINWVVIMLFVVIIGGIGTVEGPVIGVAVYFLLRSQLAATGNWYLIVMGAVAVAVMVFAPKGIWGAVRRVWDRDLFNIGRRAPNREPLA